jgi:hypothetical protein
VSTILHAPGISREGIRARRTSPPVLEPGYRLGRYELLFPVGSGGMASVWAARLVAQHGFEKIVALKTILPAYAGDPNFQRMFLDEARTSARIEHANVVRVLDLGDEGGVLFLVMEWVEGETLSSLADAASDEGKAIPLGILLRIAVDVCAGLHAAHELEDRKGVPLDVVHRDVSPQNIMVSKQGVAKVIDFGIAKARDRTVRETDAGAFKGKLQYLAPEQALAPKTIDRRTDVWAIGAVLYRCITGRAPYETENAVGAVAVLQKREPPSPMPESVPAPIRAVVSRALEWAAEDRYPTAEALRGALEGAMFKSGVVASAADVATHFACHMARRLEEHKRAMALAFTGTEVGGELAKARGSQSPPAGVAEPDQGSRSDLRSRVTEPDPTLRYAPLESKAETSATGVVATLGSGARAGSSRRWSRIGAVVVVAATASILLGVRVGRGQHIEPTAGIPEPGPSTPSATIASAACVDVPPAPSAVPRPPPPLVRPPAPTASANPPAQSPERPPRSTPRRSSPPGGAQRTPSPPSTSSHDSYYGF